MPMLLLLLRLSMVVVAMMKAIVNGVGLLVGARVVVRGWWAVE